MRKLARILNGLLTGILTGLGVVLYFSGIGRAIRFARRKTPRVLMYHACEPEEIGFTRGLSINTPPARFSAQLDFLARHYAIVSLNDLRGAEIPDCAVAITFDDGYRSVYTHAFPRLKARAFPATVFLVSEALNNRGLVWLNGIAWYYHRHPESAGEILADRLGLARGASWDELLDALIAGYDPALMAELDEALGAKLGISAAEAARREGLYLEDAELDEMARHGITFGNHTASHPNLGRLSRDAQHAQLTAAGEMIRNVPGAIDALAYPFGIFNDATQAIAEELGYSMRLEVKGDNRPLDLRRIARLNVTSDSPAVLFAKMEVVYPAKAYLSRLARRIGR